MPTTTNDKGEQPTTLYPRTDETLGVLTSAGSSHPFDGSDADWADFKIVCKQRDELASSALLYEELLNEVGSRHAGEDRHEIAKETLYYARSLERQLTKAGALIAAEIDRLQRLSALNNPTP